MHALLRNSRKYRHVTTTVGLWFLRKPGSFRQKRNKFDFPKRGRIFLPLSAGGIVYFLGVRIISQCVRHYSIYCARFLLKCFISCPIHLYDVRLHCCFEEAGRSCTVDNARRGCYNRDFCEDFEGTLICFFSVSSHSHTLITQGCEGFV